MSYNAFVLLCVSLFVQTVLCQFGFFPQRENRRFNPLGQVENFFQTPRRTVQAILHFDPNRNTDQNIYPNRPDIFNILPYDPYERPRYPINPYPNQDYYNNINYPNRDYNNGKNIVFETTVANIPFEENYPNRDDSNSPPFVNYDPSVTSTEAPREELNEPVLDNTNNAPNNGEYFGTQNNSIPNVPTFGFNDRNERDSGPNNESGENGNGIPDVPPPGFVENENGITTVQPIDSEVKSTEIPPVLTSGLENQNNGTTNAPATTETPTTLPPLTPVPVSQSKNVNFGTQGIFMETCETLDGGTGTCITVFQCEPYFKLLQQSPNSPSVVQVLRKAHCGFDGSNPKVCCPRPNIPETLPTEEPRTLPETEAPQPSAKTLPSEDYIGTFPEPPVCGVSKASFTRVVGGVDAKLGDFPWMALLGYKGIRATTTRWLCGGSLISSRHVLTASHCIHAHEDDLYVVRLGELDLAREDDGAAPVDILIKEKIKHENYSSKAFTNDIGLLVLEKEVQFSDLIKPICIPLDTELRARSYVDYNPIIAGWGDTEFRGPSATHLQALQLPVVTNEYCAQVYSQYKAQKIDERVLCAGYKSGGKDACQGDSGGPLMQPIWNSKKFTTHMYQIGVVSFGRKCAEAGFPGVYTRVTHFVPWLQEKMIGVV